jgi:hypothetical protein
MLTPELAGLIQLFNPENQAGLNIGVFQSNRENNVKEEIIKIRETAKNNNITP